MAYLLLPDKGQTRKVPIRKNVFFVGRARENDLILQSHSLSRFHAQINRSGDAFTLVDRGSLNGVFVNGARVNGEARLKDGDILGFGDVYARFCTEDEVRPVQSTEKVSEKVQRFPVADLIDSRRYRPEKREKYLELLFQFSRGLLQQSPDVEASEVALDMVYEVWRPDRSCLITRANSDEWHITNQRQRADGPNQPFEIEISRSLIRELERQEQALLIAHRAEDTRFRASESLQRQQVNSVMCAPLWNNRKIHGFLYVDLVYSARSFAYEDLEMFSILANLLAVKLENDHLWHQVLVQQQMEQELNLAAEIQRKFFPADSPRLPGYEVHAITIPTRKVGGDSYFWHERSDGRVVFMIADVMGKGLPSALLMSQLQAIARIYAEQFDSAGRIVKAINEFIFRWATQERFISLFVLVLDPPAGSFTFSNAGHNPPVLFNAAGEQQLLDRGGMITGVFLDQEYEEGQAILDHDGQIVLYTDGIVEARNSVDEEFGLTRLINVGRPARGKTSQQVVDTILQNLRDQWLATDQEDDWTLMVIRRPGPEKGA